MADLRRKDLSLVHRVRAPSAPSGPAAPAERPPLLVLLHGVGSNELAMTAISDEFDPRFLVVSARSPIQLERFAFAWFHVTFTPAGPVIDGNEAEAAWLRVTRFIDEAVAAYDADPRRVYAVGFSQGGIVALATMLTAPERLAGAVCMSGRLPPEVLPHVVAPVRLRDKPILIVHGVDDDVLGVEFARSARAVLETLPVDLAYLEVEMGHTTTPESRAAVSSWLTRRLDD
jgi:phospholipase/carboxylesterase